MRVVIKLECSTGWWRFSFFFFFHFWKERLLLFLSIFGGLYFSICVFPIKMKATHPQVVSFSFLSAAAGAAYTVGSPFRCLLLLCVSFLMYLEGNCETRGLPRREHNWFRSQTFLWEIFCFYFPFDFVIFFYYYHFSWFFFYYYFSFLFLFSGKGYFRQAIDFLRFQIILFFYYSK